MHNKLNTKNVRIIQMEENENSGKKLGALLSGGKDSLFATYLMKKKNHLIKCIITIESDNSHSYMFHTPNISMTGLQAESMDLPLIIGKTKGEKEEELADLRQVIKKAKDEQNIEGVITGALYSDYQRKRIETVCEELGIEVFSPLWHFNQEEEMRLLLNEGFKIIFSSIACYGLNKNWLGKVITQEDVNRLVELNKNYGINIAGEGGEFESLVLDCPLFSKKIEIKDKEIIEENENTANLIINDAELVEK